jgi:TolA-binding protein
LRFASAPAARSAAYLLGRMADDAGDARRAIDWYERYLTEAPSGSLAPEALGRRMLALRRLGDLTSARRAAEDYLRRFPEGTYNGVAREMVAP